MKTVADKAERPRLLTPVFLLAMLSNFAYFTSVGALIPLLPRFVEGQLGAGDVAVGFVIGSFAFSAVILRPLSGRIGDKRGRRLLIIAGGLLFAGSVFALIPVSSLGPLVLIRIVSGVGEAFFYVGVASVINDLAPDERRGEALSYFSLALFGGLALGPVLGEIVLEARGFDAAWTVAALCSVVAGALGFVIPETRPEQVGKDEIAPTLEGVAPRPVLSFADSPRAAVRQRLRSWVHPAAIGPGSVLAASIWGLATFTAFVPLYTLEIGMSGSRGVFVFYSAIVLAIRSLGARIPDVLGPARSARAALSFAAAGLAVMAAWGSPIGLFAGTAIWSIGHSLAFPALMTMAIKNAPASERGAVVGAFTAFFDMSFGLGAMTAGITSKYLGYRGAFAGAALVAGVGLVGLFLRARSRRQAAERAETSSA